MKLHVFNNCLMVEWGMSGSDRRALEWTKIFLKKGFSIRLYTSRSGKKRYKNFGSNLKLIVVNDHSILKRFPIFIFIERTIKAINYIKEVEENDVFYSTSDLIPDALPALVGKLTHFKTKWITGLHLLAPKPLFLNFPSLYYYFSQKIVLNFAKKYADLILVSNNIDKRVLEKKGFNATKIIVTYGGVNHNKIDKIKIKKAKYEAVFIGRWHRQKGLNDLLDIWFNVCGKLPQAKLAIIGELEPFLPIIKKYGLENNIDFFGFLDGTPKYKLLKSSKILLFPSSYESFGMVVLEAMASGLPVVSYNLPITREIWRKGMITVPMNDKKAFLKEVINLLINKKLREKISIEAKNYSKKFTWEKTAQKIIKHLN